jgi:hypothetical protein
MSMPDNNPKQPQSNLVFQTGRTINSVGNGFIAGLGGNGNPILTALGILTGWFNSYTAGAARESQQYKSTMGYGLLTALLL